MSTEQNYLAALNKIADGLKPSTLEIVLLNLALPALVGFLGALLAYFFACSHTAKLNERSAKRKLATDIIEKLEKLLSFSTAYWCTKYEPARHTDLELEEAHIHANLQHIIVLGEQLEFMNMSNQERKQLAQSLEIFANDAYRVITGGNFECADREASKDRVIESVTICINAKAALYRLC